MLRVNEIFPTIQGEATWTGTPATFIRLQGCPVGCSWCDTKHTWPEGSENKKVSIVAMLEKVDPAPTWAEISAEQIVESVAYHNPRPSSALSRPRGTGSRCPGARTSEPLLRGARSSTLYPIKS